MDGVICKLFFLFLVLGILVERNQFCKKKLFLFCWRFFKLIFAAVFKQTAALSTNASSKPPTFWLLSSCQSWWLPFPQFIFRDQRKTAEMILHVYESKNVCGVRCLFCTISHQRIREISFSFALPFSGTTCSRHALRSRSPLSRYCCETRFVLTLKIGLCLGQGGGVLNKLFLCSTANIFFVPLCFFFF